MHKAAQLQTFNTITETNICFLVRKTFKTKVIQNLLIKQGCSATTRLLRTHNAVTLNILKITKKRQVKVHTNEILIL